MGQRLILTDDIDDTELRDGDGETVQFSLDGVAYEIDLSNKNAKKLREAMALYIEHGRHARTRTTSSSKSTARNREQLDEIRTWARQNGFQVADKGRIAEHVLAAWEENH